MIIRREDFKDISKLTNGSKKKVRFACDKCGVGVLQAYRTYLKQRDGKLCRRCRNKHTANRKDVKKKISEASKKMWKKQSYKDHMGRVLSKSCKEAWIKDNGARKSSIWNRTPYNVFKEMLSEGGYKIITPESDYKTSNNTIKVLCNKGHTYSTNVGRWNQGHRCPKCNNNAKLTLDEVSEILNKEGYTLVSKEYKNVMEPIIMECPAGHKFKMRLNSWRSGQRCPSCRTIQFNEIADSIKSNGYAIITKKEEYVSAKSTRIKCKCSNGHNIKIHYLDWKRGRERCKKCVEEERWERQSKLLSNENYKLIWTDNKIFEFECPEGHNSKMAWSNWYNNQRCGKCYRDSRKENAIKYLEGYDLYYYRVKRISEQNYKSYKHLINPYRLPRGRGEYHLDHKFSIYEGFKRGILPEIISSIPNLRMIKEFDNISKGKKCSISENNLMKGYTIENPQPIDSTEGFCWDN